jgi:DNA-directed RNA polymerase subunit RPC12/RpoP
MNAHIERIRQLLSELEVETASASQGDNGFSALELPVIVQEIVDDLQPILTAYDAAFYWFLFRHSIAKDGNPLIRVSRSSLRRAVVKSSYTNAAENNISLGKVQDTLRALEEIGAIRKMGEPNRQGTPYQVLIPDEIEACRKFRAERLAEESKLFPLSGGDHAREKRTRVFERDGYVCRRCGKQLTRFTATLDYAGPVSDGGDEEDLVTACSGCNSRQNGRLGEGFEAES